MCKSAIVLSGGGGLGLAHVGALKILERYYEFDYYSGVSAGAIIASAHALGYSSEEISNIIFSQNFFALAFDFSLSNFGFVRGKKVLNLLEKVFKEKTFEDVKNSGKVLKIFATDFQNGERVEISTGKISDAVMASLSVPIVFEPFKKDGKWLVDGGLSGNFPIKETMDSYVGNKIIGIDVATSLDEEIDFSQKKFLGKIIGIQSVLERTFRIFFKNQQNFNKNDSRLTIFTPNLSMFKTIDITKLSEIEKIGEITVKEYFSNKKI